MKYEYQTLALKSFVNVSLVPCFTDSLSWATTWYKSTNMLVNHLQGYLKGPKTLSECLIFRSFWSKAKICLHSLYRTWKLVQLYSWKSKPMMEIDVFWFVIIIIEHTSKVPYTMPLQTAVYISVFTHFLHFLSSSKSLTQTYIPPTFCNVTVSNNSLKNIFISNTKLKDGNSGLFYTFLKVSSYILLTFLARKKEFTSGM